jgi:hypothetical protein
VNKWNETLCRGYTVNQDFCQASSLELLDSSSFVVLFLPTHSMATGQNAMLHYYHPKSRLSVKICARFRWMPWAPYFCEFCYIKLLRNCWHHRQLLGANSSWTLTCGFKRQLATSHHNVFCAPHPPLVASFLYYSTPSLFCHLLCETQNTTVCRRYQPPSASFAGS